MIRTSETVNELFAALAECQAATPVALKDRNGNVGGSVTKYADLPAVKDALRDPMKETGLAVVQFPAAALPGFVRVITRIVHKSGQWIEEDEGVTMPAGNTAQSAGSALTYARRYSLLCAMGVVADDDDDGAAASQGTRQTRSTSQRTQTAQNRQNEPQGTRDPNAASDAQVRLLAIQCQKAGIEEKNRVEFVANLVGRPIKSTHELTIAECSGAIEAMKKDAA